MGSFVLPEHDERQAKFKKLGQELGQASLTLRGHLQATIWHGAQGERYLLSDEMRLIKLREARDIARAVASELDMILEESND